MSVRQRKKQQETSFTSKQTEAMKDHEKSSSEEWRVFSENPDKAWGEKVFLLYSPVWPVLFGAWGYSQYHLHVGDVGNLFMTILFASPNLIVPALYCPTKGLRWYETYWFKFSLWVWIFSFMASYFFTEYFFDVLGMVYHFPHLKWNLDAILVGKGKQVVPVMMYFHAWYFFMTYHTCSIIFMRIIRTAPGIRSLPSLVSSTISVFIGAWLFAWGEIFGTTMDAIKEQFRYHNMDWALTWGALCYSCYFLVSFPMVYGLDETKNEPRWTIRRVIESSLAASMLAFLLLDVVAQYVITDWKDMDF